MLSSMMNREGVFRWVEILSAQDDGLVSFKEFVLSLAEGAKMQAMDPDCTEATWRASQAYWKWCIEVDSFVNNYLTSRNGHTEEK